MRNNLSSMVIIDEWRKLANKYGLSWNDSFIKWTLPPSVDADFAVVIALQLAKKLKRSPYELALELSQALPSGCSFNVVVTREGYLNCYIKDWFYKSYLQAVSNGQLVNSYQKNSPRVNIEFVSANPTGRLHLGHLRNAVIGDVLARVYTFLGYQVTREYYINDRGNQVDELVKSVLFYYQQLRGNNLALSEENLSYNGPVVEDAARWLLESSLVKNHRDGEENTYIRKKIIDFFIRQIKADLLLCGIKFNSWFSEKKMISNHGKLDSLVSNFKEKKLVYYENDALFLRTESSSDKKDRVLIKSNGEFTYFLSDILYHLDKIGRADLLINVWGSDHHGYVERLRSALRMLGFDEHEKFVVILIQMVTLLENNESRKFSKRAGTAIGVEEALAIIGKDQLRFCLLEKEAGHTVSINPLLLKEHEEKSRLYYLQYAHARCHQLILRAKKLGFYEKNPFADGSFLLATEKEKSILKNLVRFEDIIYTVATEKKPSMIIQYLQILVREFQAYYQAYRIIDSLNHSLTKQRVFLVNAIKRVLSSSLSLCGVAASSSMGNTKS